MAPKQHLLHRKLVPSHEPANRPIWGKGAEKWANKPFGLTKSLLGLALARMSFGSYTASSTVNTGFWGGIHTRFGVWRKSAG